ncbi:MAG TPA: RsiV family protein [Pyrinomonadaceae bacterium]|nr:RsiV family protein [Pyrinomonadaceae bacterium]
MKIKAIILTFVISLAFGACRKQTTNQSQAITNAGPSPEAPFGGTAPAGEKLFFRGTIAGNLLIEMVLLKDGDRVTGTYMYPKIGKDIALAGTIDKDGNVSLTESDETGKQTGIFKGKWRSAFDSPDPNIKEIEGKWSRPDGSKETEFLVSQQPIEFTAAVKVVPKVIRETNKEKRYTVEVEYPQIEGDARFDGFNREARNLISKDVAAFKASETSDDAEATTDLPTETQNSSLDAGYDFRYATDDLISLEWAEGAYERGAAHGNHLTQVLNYDVKKGKKLALADLFIDKSKYLTVIANYCMKELKERSKKEDSMIFADQIESGAGPHADNYRAWSITKKGLWITFDPYQVAAYAAGPQYILVPYSALKDIIRPDGPIANFAK